MAADGKASRLFSGHDPAPTVSLDSLGQDGEYTPVQKDQMDLASMVDCAFSMADWSTNQVGASPSASYASARSMPGSTPTTGLDAVDSTAADLMALDSMYTALSSLGFQPLPLQDQSFKLNQVDSSVGSVHASPGVHASPVSTNHDDMHSGHLQSPLSCQVTHDCGDDMGGMCPPRSPHAGPGQAEEMNNKSMAAARSALIEMQNQGLTYQNIEELVQNIQNLLNCLREKQNVQNAMNKVHMDERLRQVVLQMIQSGNPQAAQEACMLSAALAAGGQFPGMPPPSGTTNEPQPTPGAQFQPPYSPIGANASPHPPTPDASPIPNMHASAVNGGRRTSVPSLPSLATPRHSHPGTPHDDHMYPFASPTVSSSHPRSLQPDLSPPPAPHMSFHTPSLTPRGGARPSPRPIQTIHTPSPHTPSPHTPRTPRVASGHSGSRARGVNMPAPQTPTTPTEPHNDGHADRLPTTPTQRAFKATSLQGTLQIDCKASSEPLPAPGSVRGGTGVFIPGLHRQPVGVQQAPMGGPGGGNASMCMGPGLSAPLSGGGRSGRNGAPLSAPLSDIQYAGAYDSEQQISPDSLSASAELSRVRSAAFADVRGSEKTDRREHSGPNPMMPMHAPMDEYSGSLSIMNPPAYSGPMDPPAYSGSFFTQEFPDEEESRDLSGSGPFRHMTCHSYAGGEVMRTLFSNDTSGSRRPMDPTPGDAPSPASGGHRLLAGMRQGTSAPIMESPSPEAERDDRCSISASLSPNSVSSDNFHIISKPPSSSRGPQESLADALGHLSIPGDTSTGGDKNRLPSAAQTTPKSALVSGTNAAAVGIGSVSPSPCTPTHAPSPADHRMYHRTISDRGSRGSGPGSLAGPVMPRPVSLNNSSMQHTPVTPQSRPPSTSSLYPPPSALTPSRFDRLMPAGECVPLNVTHWSQDHSSVTIFLQLERFNPASLMVQIQQHMVVVMALNSDGPSHVFMMRPEHAVRVQGSKSRPQPGNGIQIVLQKRSPGNVWTTFGIVSTPQS